MGYFVHSQAVNDSAEKSEDFTAESAENAGMKEF